ncbi:MAG: Asp-tRNA(Asn)/Glu-tRNA(Gln) amidotransferase subunit GatA [Candidatus Kerfeldbacteria bacterium]|nr:Asp-tRNA(Asn)/Glu-tRNA(Gln) amidotransferase subunit GatA [Candidatus Kerfeldbacteria bacterium]
MNLLDIRKKLDSKEISVLELTEQYLERISDTNATLNSFITVTAEHARERATHAQAEIDAGQHSALTGIPYAAKDLFCTRGIQTTGASKILKGYIPPYSATAIEKCHDAVLLGKTNMDEFAMGSSTEHSAYGPTKNPYDLERVPGGTSGGSSAAVAAGLVPFAFGTDTGGSIRQPASFCNIVGFKPTYGRISRYGVMPTASSFDTVGVFTQTVADSAFLLHELAGHDPLDATTPDVAVDDYLAAVHGATDLKGVRIGIPKEYFSVEGFDPAIKKKCEAVIALCERLGATIQEISLPNTPYSLAAYYILNPSEVSSNLARYDGMQYGSRAADATTLEEVFVKTREQGFGPEAKRRIMIGTFCLSSGYYDAYYKKAQQVRTLVKQDFEHALQIVDIILAPVSPVLPFKIGERSNDPVEMYLADIFTLPVSLAGIPALSLPIGFVNRLPTSVQFIAPQFQESRLLRVAHVVEQAAALDREHIPLAI